MLKEWNRRVVRSLDQEPRFTQNRPTTLPSVHLSDFRRPTTLKADDYPLLSSKNRRISCELCWSNGLRKERILFSEIITKNRRWENSLGGIMQRFLPTEITFIFKYFSSFSWDVKSARLIRLTLIAFDILITIKKINEFKLNCSLNRPMRDNTIWGCTSK